MAKITANNIFASSITSDKLDSSVASNLATANNANVVATIASTVAAAAFSTANNLSSILANSAPIITSITIADSSYNALDDTAANTTGGYCIITGSGFVSTPTVVFGTTSAPAVSFINSTTLRVQIPALTAASYPVYVVNSNGGTAIRVNGVTTSSFPAWGTAAALANTAANTAFSVSLSANSDSNITYSNTTSLPAGTTLASNGYFSGTVTIGTETTYSFDVKATDAENQDATRTFSLTVTVTPSTRLYAWGLNSSGELGQNDTIYRSSPTQVGTGTTWSSLGSGGSCHFGIKTDGTLWAWGSNAFGVSGLNQSQASYKSSPTQVGTLTTWAKVSAGQHSVIAIRTDGTMWSWGWNAFGTLGLNNGNIDKSSPTQVGSGTDWSFAEVSGQSGIFAGALKTDGTLWMWGLAGVGQLGQNNTTSQTSPVQVTGTTWSKFTISMRTVTAIKTNGTLWAWGDGSSGALGDNQNPSYRSSPTQIGSATTWSTVSGGYGIMAIKTDGTLWAWGPNSQGQSGFNNTTTAFVPTQVGTNTNWSKIFGGYQLSAAIKTDGTLWTWGYNIRGELGHNDTISKSSPVQVGTGTNWTTILQMKATNSLLAITSN